MVAALRPGGRLLLEEADPALQPLVCLDETGPAEALANRLKTGFRALMAERGADLAYGRTLPRPLREAGLIDVAADAYFPITGPACRSWSAPPSSRSATCSSTTASPRPPRSSSTSRTSRRAGSTSPTSPMVSAWGRKPA